MEYTSLNEGTNFLTYPTDKIMGVLGTPEELRSTVSALNKAGFNKEQVQVLCGSKGAERLDATGEHHGFLAKAYRFVERFGDMESRSLSEYKDELLDGHFLVSVDAPDEEDRTRVLDILKAHDAHRVNVFGKWTVEGISS